MPSLSDFAMNQHVKALVHGPSKSGKTFGAGTWPRPNFMDFDSGIATLVGADFINKHGYRSGIIYEQFTERNRNTAGVVITPNAFDDACKYFDEWMKPGKRDQFDTWVIDTATTMSEAAQAKGIWLLGGQIKGAKSETQSESIKHNLVVPKQQDYAAERSMVEQFVSMVKDADKHILLLCHQKEVTTDAGGLIAVVPLLTGKGVESVCLMFDDIWALKTKRTAKGIERSLVTQTDGFLKVGTRLGIPDGCEYTWDAVSKAVASTKASIELQRKEQVHAND